MTVFSAQNLWLLLISIWAYCR